MISYFKNCFAIKYPNFEQIRVELSSRVDLHSKILNHIVMAIIWIIAIVGASIKVKVFTEDLELVVVVDSKFKLDQGFNFIEYQQPLTCSGIIIVVDFGQEATEVSLTNQVPEVNLLILD
jgi:hypothetical protein